MKEKCGPILTDKEFFATLDPSREGLEETLAAAARGDYASARLNFASFIRRFLDRDRFLSIEYEAPENIFMLPGESEEEAAKRIGNLTLVSVGIPCDFSKAGRVDWFSNPTYNQYKEWTWQLSRHNELKMLAHRYNLTGDEECARTAAALIGSWLKQALRPEPDVPGTETLCWRTIECGIRMGANWPYMIFSFTASNAFTPDLITDIFKSVYEHAVRLYANHTKANWLLMEMNGLAQIGILYPFFSDSGKWRDMASGMLEKQLLLQFYPDGFHYELTTGYHDVAINNYQRFMDVAVKFGYKIPDAMLERLEKAVKLNIALMMPDGLLPDVNDGQMHPVRKLLERKKHLFPDDREIAWVLSGGKEGAKPAYTSRILEYSGFAVFRSGWGGKDVWALFDAAPFGRGHQHEDKLSVIIHAGGKYLLTEGGNYAYDDSQMRRYVLSTRAHNTIRVDGCDQDRADTYRWEDGDIGKKSGISGHLSPSFDFARGTYDEGYATINDKVVHARTVYFLKEITGMPPFFVIIDTLTAAQDHQYEMLYHVDSPIRENGRNRISFDGISFIFPEGEEAGIVCGQENPEWQGFMATGTKQGMYHPVETVRLLFTGDRMTTVIIPSPGVHNLLCRNTADGAQVLLEDGRTIFLKAGSPDVSVR